MKTKLDYNLLHRLRRGAAHMTRDQLLLKLHEAKTVIKTLEGFRALAAKRGEDFITAVRAMDTARERVTEANKEIEKLRADIERARAFHQSDQTEIEKLRADIEEQRDTLIKVIDKLTEMV